MDEARREAVARWQQVLEADDDERTEAFARSMLVECRRALEMIVARLHAQGFPRQLGLRSCATADIRTLEDAAPDAIPRAIVLFWEEVGGVRLADSRGRHVAFLKKAGRMSGGTTGALWIDEPEPEYLAYLLGELSAMEGDGEDRPFPLGPDVECADGYSGGGAYGVELGDEDWEPEMQFTDGPRRLENGPDFVSWLRHAVLDGGGFPGLIGDPKFEPLRRELTQGLPAF